MRVELEQPEWNNVLAILARASWAEANPLIMAIGEQLRQQAGTAQPRPNGGVDVSLEPEPGNTRQRPS